MGRIKGLFIIGLLALFVLSCVTVNIYFPAAQAQKTAREITNEVRGVQPGEGKGEPRSFQWMGVAYAQEELDISNATIRALKASMKGRYPKLAHYLSSGILGESSQGFLVLRDVHGLGIRDKARVNRLMAAENSDRKALYKAVAQALKIDGSQTPRLGKIFAKEWQRTAPKGTWMEVKPGEWKRK
jgi:uncharacterized protein YdbL (DUF1318 family)